MKIGVIVAMDKEYEMFSSIQKEEIKDGKFILLEKSGIGKVNAAVKTLDFIRKNLPDIIISTGVAGGADNCLEIMDVVVADKVCYHDVWCGEPNKLGQIQGLPECFCAPNAMIEKIKKLNKKNIRFGMTVSGDWFVDKTEKMREIKNNFPETLCVDMESAAIAQVCHIENVPFLSLRVISDIPFKGNNTLQYENFWTDMADKSFISAKEIINCI
jgi:adenosylhomocysteine nucleosidase